MELGSITESAGIIYGGQRHFTSRIIDKTGFVWFHDGISTGRHCRPEGQFGDIRNLEDLHRCGEKNAVGLVYARIVV
ncbi:hypothetical protein B0H11DRAFT_1739702 [Mycena galericulata]|nr:hypothetical protein B0H11DRAFT_1739702 [Mycena galericulata]